MRWPSSAAVRVGVLNLTMLLSVAVLSGCETTGERLLAQGYPPSFVSGFEDGCSSGRQAAGALSEFRKNVPAYLADRRYAMGWDDGLRQCQAAVNNTAVRPSAIDSQADRNWQHSKDQSWSKALSHKAQP